MPPAPGRSARMGADAPDVRQHLFHGAHDPGKLAGVDRGAHPSREPRGRARRHASSSRRSSSTPRPGTRSPPARWRSASSGCTSRPPTPRARPTTCRSTPRASRARSTPSPRDALAYQDIGDIKGIADFAGLQRDGVRAGRRPHLPPALPRSPGAHDDRAVEHGQLRPRLPAGAARRRSRETFTWKLPDDMPPGPVTVTATRLLLAAGRRRWPSS